MPLIVRLPRNGAVLKRFGTYRSALNVLDRKETAVQRQLRRGGLASYEPHTQATLLTLVQLAPRPTVFLDIGAHIGLYSALIASIYPGLDVDVRAFEPTPGTAALARRLATANSLPVHVEEIAISSSPGTAHLFISAKAETSNSLAAGFRESSATIEVRMTTIDDYCREHQIIPSVIKIDVETLETQVLRGGLRTFHDSHPAIVCELLPSAERGPLDEVLALMANLGYVLHRVGPNGAWVPTPLVDYRRHLNHEYRDWLFVHDRLPHGFGQAEKDWLHAIAECTDQTNVLVPGGKPFAEGWNQPYRGDTPTLARRIGKRLGRAVHRP